jgi:serine/threonine protein kinase/tetratricopeptide (TPR) repeat protein
MVDSGQSLSHYKILRPLGKGGMGEVFLAEDTVLGRKVALKFLAKDALQDTTARNRFFREAKSAAAIDDPFICKIYETGEVDGEPFIAMEYIEGESLRDRLERQPLSIEQTITTASEIAEALGVAHEHGIIHRDLKPSNIMLTNQGHAKVLDFGLAKQVFTPGEIDTSAETATSDDLTGLGVTLGTLSYMSPEQLKAQPLTPRSDVFSFGIVFHEMLTGQHPFARHSSPETINAIIAEPAPAPENKDGRIPPELLEIHDRALAKEPEDRYQNAGEIARELSTLKQTLTPPKKKGIHTIGIGIAMILAAIVVVAGLRLLPNRSKPTKTPAALSILVADFVNTTGDEMFSGVLEKATSLVLEDASFVLNMRREAALAAAESIRPEAEVLDEELARLIARREGIDVVITGSIATDGEDYVVSMSAIDAIDGDILIHENADIGGREEVLRTVGRLAGEIRKRLGDPDTAAVRHAAEDTFTASSLEAAHEYVQAVDLLTGGRWPEAYEAFSKLANDFPEMGRAYAGAATALANMNRREEATEQFEFAMAHVEHMTEREKFRTQGTYYLMNRNYAKAAEVYEEIVEAFPFDEAAKINLVLPYFYGRQMDRALVAAREAVDAYPQNLMARANFGLIAMYAGDFETAKTRLKDVLESNPAYETAYVGLSLSHLALGETEAAEQNYHLLADVSEFGASLAAAGRADMALASGRLTEACEILEASAKVDFDSGDASAAGRKFSALALAEMARGRVDSALSAANNAVTASQQAPVLLEAARARIGARDLSGASALASRLADEFAPEPRAYAKLIEGEIALASGEAKQAVLLFEEAQSILDTWLGRLALGRAYLENGAYVEAHAELEAALRRQGEAVSVFLDDLPTYHYLPPLHYWLGRALEGLGSPAAAESYRTFLNIKKNGDGDPLVADARRRIDMP